MSLTSISSIASELQNQPGWEGVRDWGLIVRAWVEIVSPTIASHSRPKSLSRGILTIATNSSSLAHQLTFGRQALCKQLNTQLILPVTGSALCACRLSQPESTNSYRSRWHRDRCWRDRDFVPIAIARARQGELLRWGMCQFCAIAERRL